MYCRYISVQSYSPSLLDLFPTTELLPATPDTPESAKSAIGYYSIPDNFAKYSLHSNFFINDWKTFIAQSIMLGLFLITLSIEYILLRKKIIGKVYRMVQRNRMF